MEYNMKQLYYDSKNKYRSLKKMDNAFWIKPPSHQSHKSHKSHKLYKPYKPYQSDNSTQLLDGDNSPIDGDYDKLYFKYPPPKNSELYTIYNITGKDKPIYTDGVDDDNNSIYIFYDDDDNIIIQDKIKIDMLSYFTQKKNKVNK